MSDRVDLPGDDETDRRVVTDGFFEREVYLSRDETAAFLRDLADQLDAGESVTISSSDWEIPFEYDDPIEIEVEFSSHRQKELELEIELTEPTQSDSIDVQ